MKELRMVKEFQTPPVIGRYLEREFDHLLRDFLSFYVPGFYNRYASTYEKTVKVSGNNGFAASVIPSNINAICRAQTPDIYQMMRGEVGIQRINFKVKVDVSLHSAGYPFSYQVFLDILV